MNYDYRQKILQANYIDNIEDRKQFLESSIKEAKEYFEANKSNVPNKRISLSIRGSLTPLNETRTHQELFQSKYNEFLKQIDNAISKLYVDFEFKKECMECEAEPTNILKIMKYAKYESIYLESVQDYEFTIKRSINTPQYSLLVQSKEKHHSFVLYIQNRIKELKLLKDKPPKKQTLNPNFEDSAFQIKQIHELTKNYFDAKLEQWQNLFSKDIQVFKNPIKLKLKVTITDLRYFFDKLIASELIQTHHFNKKLADTKAFSYQGNIINAKSYADAISNVKPKLYQEIDKIIEQIIM